MLHLAEGAMDLFVTLFGPMPLNQAIAAAAEQHLEMTAPSAKSPGPDDD